MLLLSTTIGSSMTEHASRIGRVAVKPKIVKRYNQNMRGVDLQDQKAYRYSDEQCQVMMKVMIALASYNKLRFDFNLFLAQMLTHIVFL